jgi:hypothetical protein
MQLNPPVAYEDFPNGRIYLERVLRQQGRQDDIFMANSIAWSATPQSTQPQDPNGATTLAFSPNSHFTVNMDSDEADDK